MGRYGWENAPQAVREQVERLVRGFENELGENLVGIYLHGSVAMGCFNPETSDLDLLIRTRDCLPVETKRRVIEMLLKVDRTPRQIELALLCDQDLYPWRYPTPFDLYYNDDRRFFTEELTTGKWRQWSRKGQFDEDLAAHITITRLRGICLWGEPIERAFPKVPPADYRASILSDMDWAIARIEKIPVYVVLNLSRIYAYVRDGIICSKEEGGVWALGALPQGLQPIVAQALALYRGDATGGNLDQAEVKRFAECLRERIREIEVRRQ